MQFVARYDTRCEACGERIPAGEYISIHRPAVHTHYHPACANGDYRKARRENES